MNIAVTEKYIGSIPTPQDFDQWVANLLAFNIETWGLTDQDFTKIGEQFDVPGNSLWYLPEGNYRLMNGSVSAIGLEAASCDFVNLFVYSVDADGLSYDKMIIMEYSGKRFVQYNDGSDTWSDITNLGDDGAETLNVSAGTEAPDDTGALWIDTRGIDPTYDPDTDPLAETVPPPMDGVITVHIWNTVEGKWEGYKYADAMSQDIYDPDHTCQNPFEAADEAIGKFLDLYSKFTDHTHNRLYLVHITNAEREAYNETKLYRSDLQEWINVGGKLYEEMVAFIKKASEEATRRAEAEILMDDAQILYESHTTDDYDYGSKLELEPGKVLDNGDGTYLAFEEESHGHHMTDEEANNFNSKAGPDHTHDGTTAKIEADKIMDRFYFDVINSDVLAGQTSAPRAIHYGNGRLIIMGYGSDDIFYSDDGGHTFTSIKNTCGAKNYVHLEYDEGQEAWFAVDDNLVTIMSTDNGLTWSETGTLVYTTPPYVAYLERYVKIQDGKIYQSMDAFNWYPKTLKVISNGRFSDAATAVAVEYSPKYAGVVVIVDDGNGVFFVGINDLRYSGVSNLAPEVYDRTIEIKNLDMLSAPTGRQTFSYGEDDVFTDSDSTIYGKRMYFHNGNTIYIKKPNDVLEVYKILDDSYIGTPDYILGLRTLIILKDPTDWSEIEDTPTTLAGYGIDPVAEQILTQAEWEPVKQESDELSMYPTTVYGWSATDVDPTDVINYAVDLNNGIYLINITKDKKVFIQISTGTPLQMGGLSANDNIDVPVSLTQYELTAGNPVTYQINGFATKITRTNEGGIAVACDFTQAMRSIKSIRTTLEASASTIMGNQSTDAKLMFTKGLALENYIPVASGSFAVTDACFNTLTHKFIVAGLYTPEGATRSKPAISISSNGLDWGDLKILSDENVDTLRVGCIRNVSYGHYVVTSDFRIWASDDGENWESIHNNSSGFFAPVANVSVNDKCYVFRQGESKYHIVYANASDHSITEENTPWAVTDAVIDACVYNDKVCVLTKQTDGNLMFYYATAGLNATWNTVNFHMDNPVNRLFYDLHKKQLYATWENTDEALYCTDLSTFNNWKVCRPRKKCMFEALFSGSNTELYVNVGTDFRILPTCNYSNAHITKCPITMTGTIDDEGFATTEMDHANQYHVAGCYGDGIFLIFAPARLASKPGMSNNYTIFYVNDSTNGERRKTAKFLLDSTEIVA